MWKGFSSDYVPPQDTAVFDAGEGQGLMFSPYPVPMISNGSRRLLDNCSQWTLLSNACSIGREVKNLGTSFRDATLLQVCVCVCLRASVCAHVCVYMPLYVTITYVPVRVGTRGHPQVSFHTHHPPLVLLCWFLELRTFTGREFTWPSRSSCPCLPTAGITSLCCYARLSYMSARD